MSLLKKIINIIDTINERVANVSMWLVVPLTLIVVFEVISRYFFNSPHIWVLELTSFLGGSFFMLVIGYVTLKDKHITIDVLSQFMSEKVKAIVDIIFYFLFYIMFSLILFIFGTKFALNSWMTTECSWSVWSPPLYFIKTVVPISAFLFLLQGIAVILRRLLFLVKGEKI